MTLPPLAPFPPAALRRDIPPQEWDAFLDAWITLTQAHLQLPPKDFSSVAADDGSLVAFLTSYFHEAAAAASTESHFQSEKALGLRKQCFLLSHRLLSADQAPPPRFLQWNFLANISHVFLRNERLRELLQSLWKRHGEKIEANLQKLKASLTQTLDSKQPEAAEDSLKELVPLLHTSPDIANFFIAGSDFLDSLCAAYVNASSPAFRPKIVTVASLGILALTKGEKPKFSLLSDTLYSLKSNADTLQKTGQPSLLSDLVTNTPIVTRIKDSGGSDEGTRVKNLAESLLSFRQSGLARPKKFVRRKVDKGKARATEDENGAAVHVHRMSLITQIQDLFPDLGSGFIIKCLDEYNDDVEQVTAHLLDDSLPPHLQSADRTAQLPPTIAQEKPADFAPHLAPRSTPPPPPPQRRNVFDDDEFDQLAVDTSKLHIGRRNESLTADNLLSDRKAAPNKAAILSALATFDLDDDERDDTYDVEDVGGTLDSTVPGNDEAAELRDRNEEALFRAYTAGRDVFGRDAATRRGKAREALRAETGMTDEAIEGWAIMTARDPRKMKRLEAKFSAFDGQQRELESTRWRDSPAGSGAEDTDGQDGGRGGRGGGGRGRGGRGGRGRGRGRGGGGANVGGASVAGSSDDKGTQVSRQRKEANKSSRANHNRRDQRARKMARGGFPG